MADGNFLPEDDLDFLVSKQINYRLLREAQGDQERRGIEFLDFEVPPNLFIRDGGGSLVRAGTANLMVIIPKGYAKAKLDSWYLEPALYLANGEMPDRANSINNMFGRDWQFWSRHLEDHEWRDGIDGLETYIQYIRAGLREP